MKSSIKEVKLKTNNITKDTHSRIEKCLSITEGKILNLLSELSTARDDSLSKMLVKALDELHTDVSILFYNTFTVIDEINERLTRLENQQEITLDEWKRGSEELETMKKEAK